MTGYDALIEQLLYEAALSGTQGIGVVEFENAVSRFYDQSQPTVPSAGSDQYNDVSNLLFSKAPPAPASSESRATVDDQLLESIFEWLRHHPEIEIRQVEKPHDDYGELHDSRPRSKLAQTMENQRIFATDERMWQVLTGHGVDHKLIPILEFDILSLVAAHGPGGLIQPDVFKLTGQDKRSVPKRTDALERKGYITKEAVIGAGQKTSLLKFTRFSQVPRLSIAEGPKATPSTAVRPVARYQSWFDNTMDLLKQNGRIVATRDLRIRLGVTVKFERKMLDVHLRRMIANGCIRRVTARMLDKNGNKMDTRTKCVQLLRDPSELDRLLWTRGGLMENEASVLDSENDEAATEADVDRVTQSDRQDEQVSREGAAAEDSQTIERETTAVNLPQDYLPPQWKPEVMLPHTLHGIIDYAGPEGITSQELAQRATGSAWQKPVDEILTQLTDVWQYSQPPHLRYLTLVRETSLRGRSHIHRYRTLQNFTRAMATGGTTWDSVKQTMNSKAKRDPLAALPDLDEWGFPTVMAKELASRDGRSTLAEGRLGVTLVPFGNDDDDVLHDGGEVDEQQTPVRSSRKRLHSSPSARLVIPSRELAKPVHATSPIPSSELVANKGHYGMRQRKSATVVPAAVPAEVSSDEDDVLSQETTPAPVTTSLPLPGSTVLKTTRGYNKQAMQNAPRPRVQQVKETDFSEYDRFAQTIAEQRARAEIKAGRKLIESAARLGTASSEPRTEAGISAASVNSTAELVENEPLLSEGLAERVAALKEDILALRLPGVYLNPPGARQMKAERLTSKGRPRNALIAVFKSDRLLDYGWFKDDTAPRRNYKGARIIRKSLETHDEFRDTDIEMEAPLAKRLRKELRESLQDMEIEVDGSTTSGVAGALAEPSKQVPIAATLASPSTDHQAVTDERPAMRKSDATHLVRLPITLPEDNLVAAALAETTFGSQKAMNVSNPPVSGTSPIPSMRKSAQTNAFESVQSRSIMDLPLLETRDRLQYFRHKRGRKSAQEIAEIAGLERALDLKDPKRSTVAISATPPIPLHRGPSSPGASDMTGVRDEPRPSTKARATDLDMTKAVAELTGVPVPFKDAEAELNRIHRTPGARSARTKGEIAQLEQQIEADRSARSAQSRSEDVPSQDIPPSHFTQHVGTRLGAAQLENDHPRYEPPERSVQARETISSEPRLGEEVSTQDFDQVRQPSTNDEETKVSIDNSYVDNTDDGSIRSRETDPTTLTGAGYSEPTSGPTPKPPGGRKSAGPRISSALQLQRQKIVLDAVRECGGVFPGDTEMFCVLATAWKKLHDETPGRETADRTVRQLVDQGKLQRFKFRITTNTGHIVERTLLTEPNITIDSPIAAQMREEMVRSYPGLYLPAHVDVSDELRAVKRRLLKSKGQANSPTYPILAPAPPSQGQAATNTGEVTVHTVQQIVTPTAFQEEEELTVQQTPDAAAFDDQEAHKKGFTDAQALRQHQHAQTWKEKKRTLAPRPLAPKTPDSLKRKQSSQDINDKWRSGNPAGFEDEFQVSGYDHTLPTDTVPRPHKQLKMTEEHPGSGGAGPRTSQPDISRRKPLGTLRTSILRPRRKWWQEASQLPKAALRLLMNPAQTYHNSTGTFGSSGMVVPRKAPDSRDPGSRTLALKDAAWDNLESQDWANIIQRASGLPGSRVEDAQDLEAPQDSEEAALVSTSEGETPPPESKKNVKKLYKSQGKKRVADDEDVARNSDGELETSLYERKVRLATGRKDFYARDRHSSAAFKDIEHLIVAMALINAICGGINNERMNWSLVAHAMSFQYEGDFLRRRWSQYRKTRKVEVDRLRDAIQEQFLDAYEKDELPKVDFQRLGTTDWPALVEWVREKVHVTKRKDVVSSVPNLPESRVQLDALYDVDERTKLFEPDPNDYFTTVTDMNRKHLALRYTHGNAIPGQLKPKEDFRDDLLLLKSWVRAVAMTKNRNYNAEQAARKIGVFGEKMLQRVALEMTETKMFLQDKKGRHLPGRNYQIHNDVLIQFRRWPASDGNEHRYLARIAEGWANINSHFLQGNDQLGLIATANDGEYTALANMCSQGFLRVKPVLPDRKDDFDAPFPKLTPWGYGGASYETKKVDQSVLRSPLVYTKLAGYKYHHELVPNVPIPKQAPVVSGEIGPRIPFWVDIHGNVIEDIWDMTMRSILHLLVFRPGLKPTAMEAAHNHKLWAWEIQLVLEWMEQSRIAVRCGDAMQEANAVLQAGWRAAEWWYCAFLPEMVQWTPPPDSMITDLRAQTRPT